MPTYVARRASTMQRGLASLETCRSGAVGRCRQGADSTPRLPSDADKDPAYRMGAARRSPAPTRSSISRQACAKGQKQGNVAIVRSLPAS